MTTTYRAIHRDIAREARTHAGHWVLVRFYTSPGSAYTTAKNIREGEYTAYQPAGHYEAQCRDEPGGFPTYVRYIGPQEP